jgi:hypothetical protein
VLPGFLWGLVALVACTAVADVGHGRADPLVGCPFCVDEYRSRPVMRSTAFSAIITVGAWVLELTIAAMTEASTTRSPSMPWTRRSGRPPTAQKTTNEVRQGLWPNVSRRCNEVLDRGIAGAVMSAPRRYPLRVWDLEC